MLLETGDSSVFGHKADLQGSESGSGLVRRASECGTFKVRAYSEDWQGSDGEVETHWLQIDLMVSWAHDVRARLQAHAQWMDLARSCARDF